MTQQQWSGFFLDVEAFMGSTAVRRMSMAEVGVYVLMLMQQWRAPERSLPDDVRAVADLIAVTPAQAAEVAAAWEVVRRKFVLDRRASGRIYNIKLEHTRRAQRANLRKRREAGRLGGIASASKRWGEQEIDRKQSLGGAQPSSTDQMRVDQSREDERRGEEKREAVLLADDSPAVLTFPARGKQRAWILTTNRLARWAKQYPGLNVADEATRALAWLEANPQKTKTAQGMPQFLVNWFNRSVNRGGRVVGFASTADYNRAAGDEAERLILEAEARRTGTHGHRG